MLEERPVPIYHRRQDVPVALAAVIEMCLFRDPEERCINATSGRKALKAFC